MDKKITEALLVRNERIIEAVIDKSRRVWHGSVALIGIYGSFASDDIHKSPILTFYSDKRSRWLQDRFMLYYG